MYCKNCGQEVSINSSFCEKCGQQVDGKTITISQNRKMLIPNIGLIALMLIAGIIIFFIGIDTLTNNKQQGQELSPLGFLLAYIGHPLVAGSLVLFFCFLFERKYNITIDISELLNKTRSKWTIIIILIFISLGMFLIIFGLVNYFLVRDSIRLTYKI